MAGVAKMAAMLWLLAAVFMLGAAVGLAEGSKHGHNFYDFFVKETTYSRLCKNKTLLTVNGQFPGPTITARRGERVIVNVHNQGDKNITIHWHGVDQPRNPWYDGPEFITQCPIQPGTNFTYEILLSEEEGTIWWHAHSGLDRAGVHGAFIVHPKKGTDYPFIKNYKKLHKEIPIILGEWWNSDLNLQLEEYLKTGGEIHNSNAHTINGQPGDLYPCSRKSTFNVGVKRGKTYLLRIINAGLDGDMFFGVAGHLLTVVGTDGRYLKPFTVPTIMISPGQTMDALLEAKRSPSSGRYYMASKTYLSNPRLAYQNGTATAILEYKDMPLAARRATPVLPNLPNNTDDAAATGTKVKVLEYGAVVEIVFQDTDILGAENHPMHLHGYAFYVVGRGLGVFNKTTDPATYNLVDPPYQNTVTVPKAGWVAMRFKATNPGVWFMHCHFDRHTVFGMSTSFIVKQGKTPESKMRPRPKNMPKC
ncbi:hypothetical protein ACQ4PT_068821 [Festuca glaucescens]